MEELGYDPEAYGHVYVINYWREKTKDIYKYVGCTTDLEKRLMAHKADNQLIEAPVDYEGKEHLVTTDSEYEFAGIDEVIPVEETARPMARLYAVEKRIMLEIALENDTVHVLGGK